MGRILFVLVMTFVGSAHTVWATPPQFRNPGGKWMPQQMVENAEVLRQLGLEIDPAELADPQSGLMKAIVSLGGCSGSFISPEGLIITNHHCVDAMLSFLSQQDRAQGREADYVRTGIHARERSQERNVGPARRIYVTQKFVEVTDRVLGGLGNIQNPVERQHELERRIKQIIAESENGRPHIKAQVPAFFQGEKYYLVERLEIKDVRLVYAPPKSIGAFAEDPDNWRYPRHDGDFAVLRAYVGPDGKPAAYSEQNVPYRPESTLKVSAKGLHPGSLVMVAGYPGSTSRLNTADQVQFQMERSIPLLIDIYGGAISRLDALGEHDDNLRIKSEGLRKGLMNTRQNQQGALEALASTRLLARKQQFEKELSDWVAADTQRQSRFGSFLEELQNIRREARVTFESDTHLGLFMRFSTLLGHAMMVVRMAEERPKADVDRILGYQQRDWEMLRQSLQMGHSSYDRDLDLALMTFVVEKARALPQERRPNFVGLLIDEEQLRQGQTIRQQLETHYAHTQLGDLQNKLNLFDNATLEQLQQSQDTMIQLALKLWPFTRVAEQTVEGLAGRLALVIPRYIQAIREFTNRPLASDANSTLRVTFGQVKGFTDPANGQFYHPFTTVSQMIQKAVDHKFDSRTNYHYDLPQPLMQAALERRYGRYADPHFGEVPVDFVADVDTTGGNSGSAALNSRGELVGLLFDGTLHSLNGDWHFEPNNRSVLMDIRFALWVMEHVYNVKSVMNEIQVDYPDCRDALLGHDDINPK